MAKAKGNENQSHVLCAEGRITWRKTVTSGKLRICENLHMFNPVLEKSKVNMTEAIPKVKDYEKSIQSNSNIIVVNSSDSLRGSSRPTTLFEAIIRCLGNSQSTAPLGTVD
ncbi:Uncharacterized protein Fot_05871 [Forsythia ovata]|uniref:Uncharacterized protein n=1 Tax=Forsythia ovata TaxID=205694 RepID=A0ABD1WRB9_9LAMI